MISSNGLRWVLCFFTVGLPGKEVSPKSCKNTSEMICKKLTFTFGCLWFLKVDVMLSVAISAKMNCALKLISSSRALTKTLGFAQRSAQKVFGIMKPQGS